jgi:hypothetical protein
MDQSSAVKPQVGAGSRLVLAFWLGALWSVGYLVIPYIAKTMPDPAIWQPLALGLKYLTVNVGIFCGAIVLVARLMELQTKREPFIESQTSLLVIMLVLSGVYSYRQYQVDVVMPEQDLLYGMISLLGIIYLANRKD